MDFLSVASGGILPSTGYTLASTRFGALANGGLSTILNGMQLPTSHQTQALAVSNANVQIPKTIQEQLNSLVSIKDPYGHVIVPTANGYVDVGVNGSAQPITGDSLNVLLANNTSLAAKLGNLNLQSFTGTDLKIIIEVASNSGVTNSSHYKQLVECHTISVSSYRVKNPVRSLGYTNPKGFSRGPRTLAGTMVLNEMSVDVLIEFLQSVVISDRSKDSNITKADQLPPFNITMIFANEEGAASYRRLLGVEFLNDGIVYSVQDMYIERTISWMAEDFTPLLPLDTSKLFKTSVDPTTKITNASTVKSESTPFDYMKNPDAIVNYY